MKEYLKLVMSFTRYINTDRQTDIKILGKVAEVKLFVGSPMASLNFFKKNWHIDAKQFANLDVYQQNRSGRTWTFQTEITRMQSNECISPLSEAHKLLEKEFFLVDRYSKCLEHFRYFTFMNNSSSESYIFPHPREFVKKLNF